MLLSPENIATRNDLAKFVAALAKESSLSNKKWENKDLSSFLEAMAAWVEDMDGYYANKDKSMPIQPSWKMIGEILKAATMYE